MTMERVEISPGPEMSFTISEQDAETVVTIKGELDISNVERLDGALAPFLGRRPPRLIIDVSELGFADSSAIAIWVRWSRAVGELRLRGPQPLLARLIDTMGLGATLPVER
jgi:anti-sigma B factor antagonist